MKTILSILAIAFCTAAFAQSAPQLTLNNNIQRFPRGFVTTLPGRPPEIRGTSYLYDDWRLAVIVLTDDKIIEDIPVKVDLYNMFIEIDHNGQSKVLEFDRVKAVDLKTGDGPLEHLVSGKSITFSGTRMSGLFSFVKTGKYNLLLLTQAVKKAPSYNAALDIGSRDYELVKEKYYFVMKDNVAVRVDKSRKKFSEELRKAFGESFEKKLDNVKVGKEPSLVAFVSTLNATTL
jgi:hypothetical protein